MRLCNNKDKEIYSLMKRNDISPIQHTFIYNTETKKKNIQLIDSRKMVN